MKHATLAALALLLAASVATDSSDARPLRPTHDGQVLSEAARVGPLRTLQRQHAARPQHLDTALRLAQAQLHAAHAQGDPRFASRALAVLQPVAGQTGSTLLRAKLLQHLHDYESAAETLEIALRSNAQQAQAWWLLAAVRRSQGKLVESDGACQGLRVSGAHLHAAACQLENASLRDPLSAAPSRWQALLAAAPDATTRAWLQTAQAEHLLRAGLPAAKAERALRTALALHDDSPTRCALADLLQTQRRHAEAWALLQPLPASDPVQVRRALHAKALQLPEAARLAAELRSRFARANERHAVDAQEPRPHLREQTQFALLLHGRASQTQQLARDNLKTQREPLDLLLLAQAGAPEEAKRLAAQWERDDARLHAAVP